MAIEHEIADLAFEFASKAREHVAIQLRADIHGDIYGKAVELVKSKVDRIRADRICPIDAAQKLAAEIVRTWGSGLTTIGWETWVDRIRREMPIAWWITWEGWRATEMGVDPSPRRIRSFFPICGPTVPTAWYPDRVTEDPSGLEIETNFKTSDAAHLTRVFAELEAIGLMVREMTLARRDDGSSWRWLACEGPMPDLRAHGEPFYD